MSNKKAKRDHLADAAPEALVAPEPEAARDPSADRAEAAGAALVEPADEHIRRLTDELAQVKDQYLRLAADHDNFRRRAAKERSDAWARAQAEVVANILDALDDLGRVAHLDPDRTTTRDLAVGVELVERKLLKELEGAGLERVGTPGEPFDPKQHEAVSTVPAASPDQDHLVAAVFQAGYRFAGALLRPARVQVQVWQGGASPEGPGEV